MTLSIDPDATSQNQSIQPLLPFDGADLDRSGIRLTRAEFARFLGVSKQAVTDYVKSGKIVLGADGRLDPRQAVSQLLRSTDPARLRSKVLAPLVKDVGQYQQRIADLESQLSAAAENESFAEDSVMEVLAVMEALETRLQLEWTELHELDNDIALGAISAWIEKAQKHGTDPGLSITSFVSLGDDPEPEPLGAPDESQKGAGSFQPGADDTLNLDNEGRGASST